ncbi:MAG TPA: AAA family ATPase [Chryseosolibacter sp.]
MKRFPKLANPFPLVGYNGPHYFCDRKKELAELRAALLNGRNVALIARRRIGKSSLLEHMKYSLEAMRPAWKVLYIDLIKSSTLQDLFKLLAAELVKQRKKGFLAKFSELEVMSRLKMTISLNPMTQLPDLSFQLRESQTTQSLSALLDWIASEKNVLIIMDEFQQVLNYPEKNAEGYLRSEMMRLPNVRFIFSGSDQRLMAEMFQSHTRPFFNSTQMMGLEPIDSNDYSQFIINHFKAYKRTISADAVEYILQVSERETYAVQKICNSAFASGVAFITLPIVKDIFVKVLLEQQGYYENVRTLLRPSSVQFQLLRAMATERILEEPTGKDFMSRNSFTNSSSILKALKALETTGLISRVVVPGKGHGYYINDALFKSWLNTLP